MDLLEILDDKLDPQERTRRDVEALRFKLINYSKYIDDTFNHVQDMLRRNKNEKKRPDQYIYAIIDEAYHLQDQLREVHDAMYRLEDNLWIRVDMENGDY